MKFTARNSIIWGFIISCVALVISAVVLSDFSDRLKDTENEYAALTESLQRQTNVKEEGEKKFETYRLNANLVPLFSKTDQEYLLYDATSMFHDSMLYLYAAGNNLSMIEFRRAETEIELEDEKIAAESSSSETDNEESEDKSLSDKEKKVRDAEKFDRAFKTLEVVENESGEIDYKAKHRALTTITHFITEEKDAELKSDRFSRINDFLNKRYIQSYDKKQRKIAELKVLKEYQSNLVNYSTFGALILQMLGLVFIFLKDFIQEIRG